MILFINYIIIIFVALIWILFVQINTYLLSNFALSEIVDWIFLPSGFRLVSVIIFDYLGAFGLFLGALYTYYNNNIQIGSPVILALLTSISPMIAVAISKYLFNIDSLFNKLTAETLLLTALIATSIDSIFHEFYFYLLNIKSSHEKFLIFFLGDFFGALLFLYTMSIGIKLLTHALKK